MAFEADGRGMQWYNMHMTFVSSNFTAVLYMMLADGFLYGIIGWYIRNLVPGNCCIPLSILIVAVHSVRGV